MTHRAVGGCAFALPPVAMAATSKAILNSGGMVMRFNGLACLTVKTGLVVCLLGSWSPCVSGPIRLDQTDRGPAASWCETSPAMTALETSLNRANKPDPAPADAEGQPPVRNLKSPSHEVSTVPEPATLLVSAVGIAYLWTRPRRF